MEQLQIIIILFSSLLGRDLVLGYSIGPPNSACTAMFPSGHGVAAQSSASPYSISASANTYSPGEQISVTITSSGDNIKGFILEARRSDPSLNSDELIGTFTSTAANTKNNVCLNNGALTHSAPLSTTNLTATWTAPSTAQGHIVFVATVVKLKTEFWQNIRSSVVSDLSLVLPTYVNSTNSSILIWKQVNSTGVDKYTSEYKVKDGSDVATMGPEVQASAVNNGMLHLELTGLQSGTVYTITINKVFVTGSTVTDLPIFDYATEPSPPASVTTQAVTETSITVQWSAPTGGGDYDSYAVTRTNGTGAPETKNVFKSASTQVEFTDLTSGQAYGFSVMTIYKSLQSSVVTHVDNAKPKPPSSLRIENPEKKN